MDCLGVRRVLEVARRLIRRLGFRHEALRPVHPRAKPEIQKELRSGFGRLAEEAVPDGVATGRTLVHFQDATHAPARYRCSPRSGICSWRRARQRIMQDHCYV